MSKLGSLYIELGEPEGELSGGCCEVDDWAADEITRLRAEVETLNSANAELEQTFDLRHNADMRGLAMWRLSGARRDLKQPDHADLVVFLIGEVDALREKAAKWDAYTKPIREQRPGNIRVLVEALSPDGNVYSMSSFLSEEHTHLDKKFVSNYVAKGLADAIDAVRKG